MAAILGCDPFQSPHDVYLSKVFTFVDPVAENEAIAMGNEFEAPLVDWAAAQLGLSIQKDVRIELAGSPIAVNLDGVDFERRIGVEAKTGSSKGYGKPGTDSVPDRVMIQAQTQILAANLDRVVVPLLTGAHDRLVRNLYMIERNDRLGALILEAATKFWNDHVLFRRPPADSKPSLDTVQRIRRRAGAVASVTPEIALRWLSATADKLAAERAEKDARRDLLAVAGDATVIDYGDAQKQIAWSEIRSTRISEKALRRLFPEIAKQVTREVVSRKLGLTKVKRGGFV